MIYNTKPGEMIQNAANDYIDFDVYLFVSFKKLGTWVKRQLFS